MEEMTSQSSKLLGRTFHSPALVFRLLSLLVQAICLNRIVHFLEVIEQSSNPEHSSVIYKLQNGGVWCVALALSAIGGGVFQNLYFVSFGQNLSRQRL